MSDKNSGMTAGFEKIELMEVSCTSEDKPTAKEIKDLRSSILKKASRLLFAVDVVSYISKELHCIPYNELGFNECRESSCYTFNDNIKQAINFARWQILRMRTESFEVIGRLCTLHSNYYCKFTAAVLGHFLNGFDAGALLYYSVFVAELAAKCCRTYCTKMLDFAVYSILDGIDILTEDPEHLQVIAEKVTEFSKDRTLFPEYEPRVYGKCLNNANDAGIDDVPELKTRKVTEELLDAREDRHGKDIRDTLVNPGTMPTESMSLDDKFESYSIEHDSSKELPKSSAALSEKEIISLQNLAETIKMVVSYEATMFSEIHLKYECFSSSDEDEDKSPQTVEYSGKRENEEKPINSEVSRNNLLMEADKKSNPEYPASCEPIAELGKSFPDVAVKILFAEDFVLYVSKELHGIPFDNSKVAESRDNIYNGFNEVVKKAVHFLCWQVERMADSLFDDIKSLRKLNKSNYSDFFTEIISCNDDGINAGVFLHYCVYFAKSAVICYSDDYKEVLDYAVKNILDAFNILTEEWDEINVVAKNIVKFSEIPILNPGYNPTFCCGFSMSHQDSKNADDVLAPYLNVFQSNSEMDVQGIASETEEDNPVAEGRDSDEVDSSMEFENVQRDDGSEVDIPESASLLQNNDELIEPSTSESIPERSAPLSDSLSQAEIKELVSVALEARLIVCLQAELYSSVPGNCENMDVESSALKTNVEED